jgi:peptidoglycan/LPS O-acetylase OafA/YrhL
VRLLVEILGTAAFGAVAVGLAYLFGWDGRNGFKFAALVIVFVLIALLVAPEVWDRLRLGPRPPGTRVKREEDT